MSSDEKTPKEFLGGLSQFPENAGDAPEPYERKPVRREITILLAVLGFVIALLAGPGGFNGLWWRDGLLLALAGAVLGFVCDKSRNV